jgi:hypothetical protein
MKKVVIVLTVYLTTCNLGLQGLQIA